MEHFAVGAVQHAEHHDSQWCILASPVVICKVQLNWNGHEHED